MRATLIALPLIAAVAVAASTAFAAPGPDAAPTRPASPAAPASPAEAQADPLRRQLTKERRVWDAMRTRLTSENRALERENRALERQNRRMRSDAGRGVSAANGHLRAIALCESRGVPSAISRGGTYRGKYQFDYRTWRSVGGSGDPARAPEAEQDWRAYLLYERRGAQPWPVCG